LSIKVNCQYCGKEFDVSPSRLKAKSLCCSIECSREYKKSKSELNCTCDFCGKKFHRKPSHIDKSKFHYCSAECHANHQSILFSGENNHQYGLKGKLNASWESDERISHYGYKQIRCLNHPFSNKAGFVFEHRLVAEKYLLNSENCIVINGKSYLKKEWHVHHIDFNKLNNDKNNLFVITKSFHMQFHDSLKIIHRDELGRIKSLSYKYDIKNTKLLKELFFEFIKDNNLNVA
jgi:hypothetical protein